MFPIHSVYCTRYLIDDETHRFVTLNKLLFATYRLVDNYLLNRRVIWHRCYVKFHQVIQIIKSSYRFA